MPNGWNRQTFNVMMYFANVPHAYKAVREFMQHYGKNCNCCRLPYFSFVLYWDLVSYGTEEGTSFLDSRIDFEAMDLMFYDTAERFSLDYDDVVSDPPLVPRAWHFDTTLNEPVLPW